MGGRRHPPPESFAGPMVCRLAAGGSRIRTVGSARDYRLELSYSTGSASGMTKARCCAMIGAVPISRRPRHFDRSAFPAGGYRFIAHQFQYSGGIAAKPGFRIERARFTSPLPLAEGFDAMEAYLTGIGRSPAAFCACSCAPRRNSPTSGSSRSIGIMSSGWPVGGFSATRSTRLPAPMSARKSIRPPRSRSTPSATPCRAKRAQGAALLARQRRSTRGRPQL